MSIMSSFAEGL